MRSYNYVTYLINIYRILVDKPVITRQVSLRLPAKENIYALSPRRKIYTFGVLKSRRRNNARLIVSRRFCLTAFIKYLTFFFSFCFLEQSPLFTPESGGAA